MSLRIAVDVMGGDSGPTITLPASLASAAKYPEIEFQFYGERDACRGLLPDPLPKNVCFIPTSASVLMEDSPALALRRKRDSSMGTALQAVSSSKADGCISAGNTGALMAMCLHFLEKHPKIDRPVLCQALPTHNRPSYLLDLGANVNVSADQLVQFACLGAALAATLHDLDKPSVKILNIGSEGHKGTSTVKEAAARLAKAEALDYQGYIEGHELYQGEVDVIVCDGFAGNIALKTSEGVARFVISQLKTVFSAGHYNRFIAWLAKPILQQWLQKMNPGQYNGAYFIGVRGSVVKSHGNADQWQFSCALNLLIQQLQQQRLISMETRLEKISHSLLSVDG